MTSSIQRIFALVVGLCLCGSLYAQQPEAPDSARAADTLVLGKVTNNPKKHYPRVMRMATYLVSHLNDLGIHKAKVVLAKNHTDMAEMLGTGQVDLISETLFGAVIYMDTAGAQPFLLKWKKGVRQYHSIIVANKESGINSLEDLPGKTIAFEDTGSTSAYLLPWAELKAAGLKMQSLETPRARPDSDRVGYAFSASEQSTAAWVSSGMVDVGAFSNLDWEKTDHVQPGQKAQMKIIHRSRSVPRSLELVGSHVPEAVRQRIASVLLTKCNTPEAKRAMKAYQKTSRFEQIDDEMKAVLDYIREQMASLPEGVK